MPLNVQTFRAATARPGSIVYFWFPEVGTNGNDGTLPTSPAGWTYFRPTDFGSGSSWHNQWAWGIKIPISEIPGVFQVPVSTPSGVVNVPVTVVAAPATLPIIKIAPGNESREFAQYLVNNGKAVDLPAGIHEWDAPLDCPHPTVVRGAGAVVRRIRTGGSVPFSLFRPVGDLRLEGLILEHSDDFDASEIQYIRKADGWDSTKHITVRNCTMRRGQLSVDGGLANTLVEWSRFENAMTGAVPFGSVWLNNVWEGPALPGQHAFYNTGATSLFLANNRWRDTARGIVFQIGECRDSVIINSYFHSIRGNENNANECILLEGGSGNATPTGESGMRRIAIVDAWMNDCSGPAISYVGGGMHDIQVWNCRANVESAAISIFCEDGGKMNNLSFQEFQAEGFIRLSGDLGNLTFSNLQVLEKTLGAGNQAVFDTVLLESNVPYPFKCDAVCLANTIPSFNVCKYNSLRGQQAITALTFTPTLPT